MITSDTNDRGSNAQPTTRPIPEKARDLLNSQSNGRPEWVRPPKNGLEFYSGFSRARLYQGAKDGDFRSVSIRKPGQVKAPGFSIFNPFWILSPGANSKGQ